MRTDVQSVQLVVINEPPTKTIVPSSRSSPPNNPSTISVELVLNNAAAPSAFSRGEIEADAKTIKNVKAVVPVLVEIEGGSVHVCGARWRDC